MRRTQCYVQYHPKEKSKKSLHPSDVKILYQSEVTIRPLENKVHFLDDEKIKSM